MAAEIPGWYVDAVEQNLGIMANSVRKNDLSIEWLTEQLSSPEFLDGTGKVLAPDTHVQTLALCVAVLLRRLARVEIAT